MSIAQQVATPTPSSKARRPSEPLPAAPARGAGRTLLGIAALVAVTALGVVLTFGVVAIALVLVVSNLGG
jgi:hypothetical protein